MKMGYIATLIIKMLSQISKLPGKTGTFGRQVHIQHLRQQRADSLSRCVSILSHWLWGTIENKLKMGLVLEVDLTGRNSNQRISQYSYSLSNYFFLNLPFIIIYILLSFFLF